MAKLMLHERGINGQSPGVPVYGLNASVAGANVDPATGIETPGAPGAPAAPIIISGSFKEALEEVVLLYSTVRYDFSLNPFGLATAYGDAVIQSTSAAEVFLIEEVFIDATPNMVSVALMANAFNAASYGSYNTTQIQVTREWRARNLLPRNRPVLASRARGITFRVTNNTNYDITAHITAEVGIIPLDVVKDIVKQYTGRGFQ